MIKVKRSTGWIGSATKMQIIVNGERVAAINNNQILEVRYKGWYKALFPLMIAITFIMIVFDLPYIWTILTFQLLVAIISYVPRGFMIKKQIDN